MKVPVYTLEGEKKEEITLGSIFTLPVREDVIRRAFLAEASQERQPYGTDPLAGKRTSAHYHGLRHYRHSMMNKEMARMKRIHGQGHLNMTARFVPQATKGRKAHPPKTEKIWKQKINKKERNLALLSALAATARRDFLASRGHAPEVLRSVPLVMEDRLQELRKAKEVLAAMKNMGIQVAARKKARAGKGKMRGRRYRKPKGPLIIISDGPLLQACPRPFEAVRLKDLNVSALAPGGEAGRLCIWTKASIQAAGLLGRKS